MRMFKKYLGKREEKKITKLLDSEHVSYEVKKLADSLINNQDGWCVKEANFEFLRHIENNKNGFSITTRDGVPTEPSMPQLTVEERNLLTILLRRILKSKPVILRHRDNTLSAISKKFN